ncbi:beta-ketoacyl-ACP synthase III [Natranaerofaba carboxydovora]|uniref:beta-ketoacyl-ACP synthase III n=1 Tax=Natranaerofaba carboxydovora TaxID=2742683 RepID=UPI001F13B27F|nr:beta-ketoacyl-ACP synthase III [Natranaerofaba carboxydovora]UMZ73322.1 3-oxoacyl-[acyl-carrier-protein] synthase 3 [Natranaerofaba carboxydovora]
MLNNIKVLSTGKHLPERVVTNKELENYVETSENWISSRTGIEERRFVSDNESTSDLAAVAAKEALKRAEVKPEEVSMIVVTTMTPDMPFPSTACLVQDKIGAENAFAFDLEAACSGFLYGLIVGSQFVSAGSCRYVLVIGAETMSKILDFEDRSTCVLFGDGAGACLLGKADNHNQGILSFDLGADGGKSEILKMPGGGSLFPASHETVKNRYHYLKMNGNEVYKFAVKFLGQSALKTLEDAGKNPDEIDLLIPHQANLRIIDSAVKKLGIDYDKVFLNVAKYGNMSAASIPVALDEALDDGKITRGDLLVLVGFGAGLTWGSCVLVW